MSGQPRPCEHPEVPDLGIPDLLATVHSPRLVAFGFPRHVEVFPREELLAARVRLSHPRPARRLAGVEPTIQRDLLDAVLAGDHCGLRWALALGAKVDGEPPPGYPIQAGALHVAATCGNLDAAAMLVAKDNAVGARGDYGPAYPDVTPLHLACLFHRAEMIAFLLRQGADVDAKGGHFGQAPLHLALSDFLRPEGETRVKVGGRELTLRRDSGTVCEMLLAHGANFTWADQRGHTPLREATIHQHADAVPLLRTALQKRLLGPLGTSGNRPQGG